MNNLIKRSLCSVLSLALISSNLQIRIFAEEETTENTSEETEVLSDEAEVVEEVSKEAAEIVEETTSEEISEETEVQEYQDEENGDYTYTVSDEEATITDYTGTGTSITIPSELDGYPVTEIGSNAFSGTSIEKVVLPETLIIIDWKAFYNCSSLKEVVFPSTLVEINREAFRKDTSLEKVVFNDGLEGIDYLAFEGCSSLKEVVFPDSLTEISYEAFSGCPIENLKLPSKVESIGSSSFANNPNLESITLPKTLTGGIGSTTNTNSPFYGCDNLTEILFEEGYSYIPRNFFNNLEFLERIVIPEGVEDIGWGAFYRCSSLKEVVFPSTLKVIEREAFRRDSSLEKIVFCEGLEKIEYLTFKDCPLLKTVYLPNTLQYIGDDVFPADSVLYTNYDAYGVVYAIDNGFEYRSLNAEETPSDLIDRNKTSYYADTTTGMINNTVTFCVDVDVKDDVKGNLSNRYIHVYTPEGAAVLTDSVTFNGVQVTPYVPSNSDLCTVPIDEDSGTLRITMKMYDVKKIDTYALYEANIGRDSYEDVIGVVNGDLAAINMNIPTDTATSIVEVSGKAPADTEVELYIDDVLQTTVTAKKNGSWYGEIDLGDPIENYPYTVEARLKGSEDSKDIVSTDIYYNEGTPSLETFTVNYYEHADLKMVDLLIDKTAKIYKTGDPYVFELTLSNDTKVDKVYVNSIKGSEVSRMEAVYHPETGKYVAEGYFGRSSNYIPGNITVSYVKKEEKKDINIDEMAEIFETSIPQLVTGDDFTYKKYEDDEVVAEIDLGKSFNDFQNTTAEIIYKHYHGDGTSIFDFIDYGEHVTDFLKTFCIDGEDYIYNVEAESPAAFTVVVGKIMDPVLNIVDDVHSMGFKLDGTYKWSDKMNLVFSEDQFKDYKKGFDFIYKTAKIYAKDEELRKKILYDSGLNQEQTKKSLKKLDELTTDKIAFTAVALLGKEALKGAAAAGAVSGPIVVMTVLVAAMVLASEFLFELREDELTLGDAALKVMIDPSGYVYDTVTEERIEDVQASAYWIEYDPAEMSEEEFFASKPEDTEYGVLWDAEDYEQVNPQMTDWEGRYQWDVPTGWWRVQYEKEGYGTAWSEWLPVPPPQLEVNVGLVPDKVAVTGITLNKEAEIMTAGSTLKLEAEILPKGAQADIKWSISDEKILTVDNGTVTAKKAGIATITAEAEGYKAECRITVLFDDVQDAKKSFYAPVYWAVENGITTGTGDTTFDPGKTCTRAQFVTFLWRQQGKPEPTLKESPFKDVQNKDLSYYKAVLWAVENKITTGTSATTFDPGKKVTRAQAVTFLWRANNKPAPKTTVNPFTDVKAGLSYSDAVLWAFENKITTGTSATTFNPGGDCTRGATVTFLYRTYKE